MTKLELENQANAILIAAKANHVELQGDFPMTILLHRGEDWRHLPFPEEAGVLLNVMERRRTCFSAPRAANRFNRTG